MHVHVRLKQSCRSFRLFFCRIPGNFQRLPISNFNIRTAQDSDVVMPENCTLFAAMCKIQIMRNDHIVLQKQRGVEAQMKLH